MGRLEELHGITLEMARALDKEHQNGRERTIETISELIGKRERVMRNIKAPYTDEEEMIGKKIVQLNEEIKTKMDELYFAVKDDMKRVKRQKERNRSYINPYGEIKTTDGMYLDRKQ